MTTGALSTRSTATFRPFPSWNVSMVGKCAIALGAGAADDAVASAVSNAAATVKIRAMAADTTATRGQCYGPSQNRIS